MRINSGRRLYTKDVHRRDNEIHCRRHRARQPCTDLSWQLTHVFRWLLVLAVGQFIILTDDARAQGSVETDRAALVALYHATGGPNWPYQANWLTDKPLSEWYGVRTHDGILSHPKGRVHTVGQTGLSGSIPAELAQLPFLGRLAFRDGSLSGPIPTELAQLPHLSTVDLGHNEFSGPIPTELVQLPHLSALILAGNQFSGPIPAELAQLKLWRLDLRGNQLSGPIPPQLGQLTNNISSMDLSHNQLSGPIPPQLGRLTFGIPGLLLGALDLSYNQLSGPIPGELGQLTNLGNLDLGGNQLSGPIPPQLGQLTNLYSMELDHNQLSGPIPGETGQLTNLEILDLSHNQLSGPIPPQLGRLTGLGTSRFAGVLDLSHNQLSGPIPGELGQLTNIWVLHLDYNQLSGPIPAAFGNLGDIAHLHLGHNQLSGPIPATLGNLTDLSILGLQENRLSGPIPAALGNMLGLRFLDIDSDTGLCLEAGFPVTTHFGRLAQTAGIPMCGSGGFTDDPIVAGRTPVRAVHFTELRVRIDALRVTHDLVRFPWTDSRLAAGVAVRGIHMSEIRTALRQVYEAARRTPAFSTAAVQAGSGIAAQHINELRRAVEMLDGGEDSQRSGAVGRP